MQFKKKIHSLKKMPYVRKLIRLISPHSAIIIISKISFQHNLAIANQKISPTSMEIHQRNQIIPQFKVIVILTKIRTNILLIISLWLMELTPQMKRKTKHNLYINPPKQYPQRNSLPCLHYLTTESSIYYRKSKMTISN